jgi:hypothetical protein
VLKGATLVGAALSVALVVRTAHVVPLRIVVNYNEGWNAYHTADLMAGRPLYPDPAGVYLNNYPPLSFYIVAAATRAVGDPLIAGRVVSLLAFVALTALLAGTAIVLGCGATEALFAAAVFALDLLLHTDYYVGADDPQLLALAVSAAAIAVVLPAPRTSARLALAATLLVAAVFIKHNLFAPIATAAWLLIVDRRSGWRLIGCTAALAAAAAGVSLLLFGRGFATGIMMPRLFTGGKLQSMAAVWLPRWTVFLIAGGALARRLRGDERALFAILYAAVATAGGIVLLGGAGVYWNAMIEAQWALCLTAAVVLDRLKAARAAVRRTVTAAYALAPAVSLALLVTVQWLSPRFWLDPRWHEAATAAREIEFLRQHAGAALCEDLTLCFFAGKTAEADYFALSQLVIRDPARARPVARRIEDRAYSVVLLDLPPGGRDVGAEVTRALGAAYRTDHVSQWGMFLVPRRGD